MDEKLRYYLSSSSFPGLTRVVKADTKGEKIVWTLLIIVSTSILLWQVHELVNKYRQNNIILTSQLSPQKAMFPWVTLCNLKPIDVLAYYSLMKFYFWNMDFINELPDIDPSLFAYTDGILKNQKYGPKDYFDLTHHLRQLQLKNRLLYKRHKTLQAILDSLYFDQDEKSLLGFNTTLLLGVQKEDMILLCTYKGLNCDVRSFSQTFDPLFYNCFTYEVQRKESDNQQQAGRSNGLSLLLFSGTGRPHLFGNVHAKGKNNTPSMDIVEDLTGIRLIVHPPYTKPYPEKAGIDIVPGTATSIGLEMVTTKWLNTLISPCNDQVQKHQNYTCNDCKHKCIQQEVLAQCKCLTGPYVDALQAQTCSQVLIDIMKNFVKVCGNVSQRHCRSHIGMILKRWNCMKGTIPEIERSSHNICTCQPDCHEVEYKISNSVVPWPDKPKDTSISYGYNTIQKLIRHGGGKIPWSKEKSALLKYTSHGRFQDIANFKDLLYLNRESQYDFLSQMSLVNVYFTSTNVLVNEQKRLYTLTQLLSDLGGQIGLWIGLSLISILEVTQILVKSVIIICMSKGLNGKESKVKSKVCESEQFALTQRKEYNDSNTLMMPLTCL